MLEKTCASGGLTPGQRSSSAEAVFGQLHEVAELTSALRDRIGCKLTPIMLDTLEKASDSGCRLARLREQVLAPMFSGYMDVIEGIRYDIEVINDIVDRVDI